MKLTKAISMWSLLLLTALAQITQSTNQLSLKPGEDEIKRKGW